MKSITKYLILAGVVMVLLAALWIVDAESREAVRAPQACPADAMLCPDGSAVGRTGPNCTFPSCPTATTTPAEPLTAPITLAIGDIGIAEHISIRVLGLVSDSRCAVGVQCIQAGTVQVRASVGAATTTTLFTLGQPLVIDHTSITLISVTPDKYAKQTIPQSAYRFTFTLVPEASILRE